MFPVPIRRPYAVERMPKTRLVALLSLGLRASDLLVLCAAALLAHKLRFGTTGMSIEFQRTIVCGLLFALLVLGPSSTYNAWRAEDWQRHALRLLALWFVVFLLGALYVALLRVPGVTSRLWWGCWFVGSVLGSLGARICCRAINEWAQAHGHDVPRAVVIGSSVSVARIACELAPDGPRRTELLGWFSPERDSKFAVDDVAYLGPIESLRAYVEANAVRQVWIAPDDGDARWTTRLMELLAHSTADIKYVPSAADRQTLNGSVELFNGMPVINLRASPLDGEARMIKGIEDRVLATLILVAIMPLMALIALGVKLSSPGPVLFVQRRHGLDCKPIKVWKFRSMRLHVEALGEVSQATRQDPRITSFGRFLRRTSLDELPQFFNVLQGTMSIVGPRPHAIEHNDQYKGVVQDYMQRHRMKPGITGWAQVNGLRGETDTLEKMARRVEYDLYYMKNWSVMFDIKIVVKTAIGIAFDRAAY